MPEISRVLVATRELVERTRKRYDDTELIMAELLEHGYDSPRGRAALRRMNQMHARHDLQHADLRYVLSTFVLEPMRWVARYGSRPLTPGERQATFRYYMEVGRRMGIRGLPLTLAELDAANTAYERERFSYDEANAVLWRSTSDMLLRMHLPTALLPCGRAVLRALVSDASPTLPAMLGFAVSPAWQRRAVRGVLRARGRVAALLGERRTPVSFTQRRRPTYPRGYAIRDLGT